MSKSTNNNYTVNGSVITEASKRHKLSEKTIQDLRKSAVEAFRAYQNEDTDFEKVSSIYVENSLGEKGEVEVYYLDELETEAVTEFKADGPNELSQYFIVVNPDNGMYPSLKSTYNAIYHELQHLTDPAMTTRKSEKHMSKYSTKADDKYYGHDAEFKAMSNEFLEALENEYLERVSSLDKKEVLESLKNLKMFFKQNEKLSKLTYGILQSMAGGKDDDFELYIPEDLMTLPYYLKFIWLLKRHNPNRWNQFLNMLYTTTEDIESQLSQSEKQEMTEKEFKKPRKYSKSYCEKTPCGDMGFTQKASCRPYKNCYK